MTGGEEEEGEGVQVITEVTLNFRVWGFGVEPIMADKILVFSLLSCLDQLKLCSFLERSIWNCK